ncbi:MAG TPA: sigma-70 family RNA polymerase sigma factor [Gemmatimonadales bacterium]|nr:sigma-70 family RNA polymerase sigma factor [Gemmatimonadales bacterium]
MSAPRSREITDLLRAAGAGSHEAMDRLIPLLYDELRGLAAGYLRSERTDHTLQTTALVHEAYLKLVDQRHTTWQNRAHFFGIAAQAMRRILVDHARRRRALKRDAGRPVTLDENVVGDLGDTEEILGVDAALERLAALDPRQARVVEMRYFAGLTIEQTAEALGVSPATVKREWLSAKAWLQRELG